MRDGFGNIFYGCGSGGGSGGGVVMWNVDVYLVGRFYVGDDRSVVE